MKILFVEGDSGTMVYCKYCGAVAGTPTKCRVYQEHNFISTNVPVICKYCGAVPGVPTKCTVYESHNFIPIPEPNDY